MGGDKILRALVAKRLELLAELERHETAAAAVRADLAHLDGSITVFMRGAGNVAPNLPTG